MPKHRDTTSDAAFGPKAARRSAVAIAGSWETPRPTLAAFDNRLAPAARDFERDR
jgi:hypothetical protein